MLKKFEQKFWHWQTFEQKLSSFLHIHVTSREVHARKSTNWRRGQLIIAWWGFWKPKNSQGEEKNMKYITILDFLGREYVRYSEFSNWWLHKVQTRGSVIYSYLCFSLVRTNHRTIHQFSEKQIIKRQLASWSISTLSKLRSSEQALTVFQQFSPVCFNSMLRWVRMCQNIFHILIEICGRTIYVESLPSILIREISDYGVLTELDNEDVKAVRIDWALAKINTQSMPCAL